MTSKLYSVDYVHDDKSCAYKRKYTFLRDIECTDICNLLEQLSTPGIYTIADDVLELDNMRTIAVLESGKKLISNP